MKTDGGPAFPWRAHLAYLSYVMRHKWFVLVAGLKVGAPFWRLIIHDWSKFTRREWTPYVHQFFNPDGSRRNVRRKDGGYDPNAQSLAFRNAWLQHQRNKHHWQAWVSLGDGGSLEPLPMGIKFVREMVADWMGAGRAITGRWEVHEWYAKNRDLMVLNQITLKIIDLMLSQEADDGTE